MAIIYAVAFGLAVGATATVARRVGEKDFENAAKTAAHVIYLGLIVSVVMSAVGLIFAPQFLSLLGAEPQVIEQGDLFTRIMLGGNAVVVFIFLLNAIFRGAGDAAIAMRVLWLANGLNIILDPLFIFGIWIFPEMGVTGAAVATTIGRGVGVLYAAWRLFRPSGRITIHKEHFAFRPDAFVETRQTFVNRRLAVHNWDGELERACQSHCRIRKRSDCGLYYRLARNNFRASSCARFK